MEDIVMQALTYARSLPAVGIPEAPILLDVNDSMPQIFLSYDEINGVLVCAFENVYPRVVNFYAYRHIRSITVRDRKPV